MSETNRGSPSDAELLRAVEDGDRGAFEELYRRYAPWLVLRLRGRCADPALVDDVVQEAFLDVWRGAARYHRDGDVAGGFVGEFGSQISLSSDAICDLPADGLSVSLSATEGCERYAPKGQRGDLEALSAGPVPYFRGTPTLFCQRQNTGRTGLDDHYSPVS